LVSFSLTKAVRREGTAAAVVVGEIGVGAIAKLIAGKKTVDWMSKRVGSVLCKI
jgi:hypothetical protein